MKMDFWLFVILAMLFVGNMPGYSQAEKIDNRNSIAEPSVALGDAHSLGLMSDGTVWAWGWNHFGQLGDGNPTPEFV